MLNINLSQTSLSKDDVDLNSKLIVRGGVVMTKATGEQIQAFLQEQSAWSVENDKLHREYVFKISLKRLAS